MTHIDLDHLGKVLQGFHNYFNFVVKKAKEDEQKLSKRKLFTIAKKQWNKEMIKNFQIPESFTYENLQARDFNLLFSEAQD